MSDLKDLIERAQELRHEYDRVDVKNGRSKWSSKDYAEGFTRGAGDLLKLVRAKDNLRSVDNVDSKLAHELAVCLWSVMVIADCYDLDLEKEFLHTVEIMTYKIDGGKE
ncbi:MAG: nucleotide pyrophosphohydrolase [Candidatus Saccharimonadales bacterium]